MTTEARTLRIAIDYWTRGDAFQTKRYLARFDEERRRRIVREHETAAFLKAQRDGGTKCRIRRLLRRIWGLGRGIS